MSRASSPIREQKKHATRQALRQATLELGLLHGLDHVHVNDIAAHAGVSPRTFFNYFDSKEDAALFDAPEFTDDELRELADGSSGRTLFDDLLDILGRAMTRAHAHQEQMEKYLRLHRENPSLVARQLSRFGRFEDKLTQALTIRLPGLSSLRAETIAGTCLVVSRTALRHWSQKSSSQSLDDLLRDAFSVLRPALTTTA